MYAFVLIISILINKVFAKGVDADSVVLMAARASRLENQDAIDTAIVGMLADPKEVSFDILFAVIFLQTYLLAVTLKLESVFLSY